MAGKDRQSGDQLQAQEAEITKLKSDVNHLEDAIGRLKTDIKKLSKIEKDGMSSLTSRVVSIEKRLTELQEG